MIEFLDVATILLVVIGAGLVMMGYVVGYIHGRVGEYSRWQSKINKMNADILEGMLRGKTGPTDAGMGGDTPNQD